MINNSNVYEEKDETKLPFILNTTLCKCGAVLRKEERPIQVPGVLSIDGWNTKLVFPKYKKDFYLILYYGKIPVIEFFRKKIVEAVNIS